MALTGRVDVWADLKETVSADLGPAVQEILQRFPWKITSGTTSGKADKIWSDERTVAASAGEDWDLNGGLTGTFGAVVFAKLKAIIVQADDANTGAIEITQEATNGVTGVFTGSSHGISVYPDGAFVWFAPQTGRTVTAGTGDKFTVFNPGTDSAVYRVILIGTSA